MSEIDANTVIALPASSALTGLRTEQPQPGHDDRLRLLLHRVGITAPQEAASPSPYRRVARPLRGPGPGRFCSPRGAVARGRGHYWITSSAVASSVSGMVMPSDLVVIVVEG